MEEKEMMKKDINDLMEKLSYVATKEIKNPEIAKKEDGTKWNVSEKERRREVREMRNRLKELIETYNTIKEAGAICRSKAVKSYADLKEHEKNIHNAIERIYNQSPAMPTITFVRVLGVLINKYKR